MTAQETLRQSATRPRSLARYVWVQPSGKIGAVLTALMLAVTVLGYFFAKSLTGHSPTELIGQPFESTGAAGTDIQGRSVLSRALAGGVNLLGYAIAASAIGVVLGGVFGVIAGYFGGVIDWIVMRINDVVLALPTLVLALFAIVILEPTGWVIVVVIGVMQAPWIVRSLREAIQAVKDQNYLLAARMYAVPHWTILTREMLPHISGRVVAALCLRFTYSIGLIASLSFLGLGIQPPTADWGVMLNENLVALSTQPWAVVLPALAIAVLTIGTSLLAHAIDQAASVRGTR